MQDDVVRAMVEANAYDAQRERTIEMNTQVDSTSENRSLTSVAANSGSKEYESADDIHADDICAR